MIEAIDSLMAGNKTRTPGTWYCWRMTRLFGKTGFASLHRFISELKMYSDYEMVTAEEYPNLD